MREGIARVFFRQEEVGFQPLSNHQGLVGALLRAWREGEGPLEAHPRTKDRLVKAGDWHDDGKRLRFRIQGEKGKLVYSFAGHRFDVAPEVQDPYAQALIRGHHDYSTPEVVGAAGGFEDALERDRFAEDLYLLMMADQLEAEVAVRVFEGKEGEVRPFVEFELEDLGVEGEARAFRLDPWPFREETLELEFKAYFHPYRGEEAAEVERWGKALAQALAEGRVPPGFRLEAHRVRLRPRQEGGTKDLPQTSEDFYALFTGRDGGPMKPTGFQREVWEAVASGHPAHLLLAPTGTGKTEAAAFPALALGMRLVFALPARSLVDDLEDRFARYLRCLADHSRRPYRLLVDTGHRQVRRVFHPGGKEETPKERHLYKADVILTTLDKLLYRYFGYAEGTKGYIFPRRIHDRKTLFVFDEAHVYEATAWANFKRLVAALYKAGVAYLVMTATMPEAYRKELAPYLEGTLEHPRVERPSRMFYYFPKKHLLKLAYKQLLRGRRVLVVVEEVRRAARIYKALKKKVREGVFLYHGRQAEPVRKQVFAEVKARDEKGKPYLLVTTRAIEVGVDLDAEVLITELCPPENLLQRLGRVNRRGKGRGEVYVVGTAYPEYLGSLPEGFTELLTGLSGQDLRDGGEEKLREAIARPAWTDPRSETLFEALHEYVYGLEVLNEGYWRKGFVATRGWEPSVTLRAEVDGELHEASVNVGMLATSKEKALEKAAVWERVFPNREKGRTQAASRREHWEEIPLRPGELYLKDVVVDYPYPYDPELGFVEVPKVFHRRSRPGEERVWLYYEAPESVFAKRYESSQVEAGQNRRALVWYLGESARPLDAAEAPQPEEEPPGEAEEGEA
jgi:CRISPR-associated endonuclease/helicase Cas3